MNYHKVFGRNFAIVAEFTDEAQANAHMLANPDHSVLAVEGDRIILSRTDDDGHIFTGRLSAYTHRAEHPHTVMLTGTTAENARMAHAMAVLLDTPGDPEHFALPGIRGGDGGTNYVEYESS